MMACRILNFDWVGLSCTHFDSWNFLLYRHGLNDTCDRLKHFTLLRILEAAILEVVKITKAFLTGIAFRPECNSLNALMWIASSFLFASHSFFNAVPADWHIAGSANAETT
jgi:hypothetical protein